MRVMMVITDFDVGGAEYQVLRLCDELKKSGNEVFIVSMISISNCEMVRNLSNIDVQAFDLGMKRGKVSFLAVFRFLRFFSRLKPQVVHTHMIHANIMVRLLYPFLGRIKVINTIHGEEEFLGKRRFFYKLTDCLADYTVCCGKILFNEAMSLNAVSQKRLRYICNGLNLKDYCFNQENRKNYREQLNILDEFVWISVGRMSEVKNQQYLIKEFKKVKEKYNSVKLILVGDGSEKNNISQLIKELNISDSVLLTGQRNDISKILSMGDAFVLSSKHEGLPLSLQEAGAICLPLVATDVGGCNEVIIEGYNGYLCESNKPDALSNSMMKILNLDPVELHNMGMKSRELIEKEFNISIIAQKWLELYSL